MCAAWQTIWSEKLFKRFVTWLAGFPAANCISEKARIFGRSLMSDSLSDVAPIVGNDSQNGVPDRFIYRGPSMTPTFRPGQVLYVHLEARDIAAGDVIVFHDHNDNHQVVHRVISVSASGLITRGDNNLRSDPAPIISDQVVGRVEKTKLGGQIRPVVGGWRGLWLARVLRAILRIKRFLRRVLRGPYRWLRASRLVAYFWKPSFSKVWLAGEDGPWVKFIHRGRSIARWWPQQNRFECQKPYDLVLRCEDLLDKGIIPK
jgi:signal peptidase I